MTERMHMIGEAIGINTVVWNPDYGFGKFKRWLDFEKNVAIVQFENGLLDVTKKHLTEIEDE